MKNDELRKGEKTKLAILDVGVKLWPNVTARGISRKLKCTHATVSYYFGDNLKDAVAAHAVELGNSQVIAQLIATRHRAVKDMTPTERKRHMNAAAVN